MWLAAWAERQRSIVTVIFHRWRGGCRSLNINGQISWHSQTQWGGGVGGISSGSTLKWHSWNAKDNLQQNQSKQNFCEVASKGQRQLWAFCCQHSKESISRWGCAHMNIPGIIYYQSLHKNMWPTTGSRGNLLGFLQHKVVLDTWQSFLSRQVFIMFFYFMPTQQKQERAAFKSLCCTISETCLHPRSSH